MYLELRKQVVKCKCRFSLVHGEDNLKMFIDDFKKTDPTTKIRD